MSLIHKIKGRHHLSRTKEIVINNLLWSVLGKAVNLLTGLFIGILVARYLGPEQYGLMNYVISYVFLFQSFSVFGLDSIEVREEAKGQQSSNLVLGTAFSLKVVSSIVFMALAIVTSFMLSNDGKTPLLVAIYSFSIVLNSFNVIRNYFTSQVKNEYIVKTEIARCLLGMGIKYIIYLLDLPLEWFVASYMFDYFLLGSGYCISYKKMFGEMREWRFDKAYAKFLVKESFPLMLTSTAVIVYQRIDQVMIGQMVNHSAVGYFSVASRFVEILIYIPIMLSQTITPVLVRKLEQGREIYEEAAQQFMNLSLWVSILLAALTSLLAPFIVTLTFGSVYAPSIVILQIMSFKAASVALSNTAGAMLVSEGLQKYAIGRDLIGCVVCIALNYIFLPLYGVLAAAAIAIASNVAAGYIADAIIPAYRHIFARQTRAIVYGWQDLLHIKTTLTAQ